MATPIHITSNGAISLFAQGTTSDSGLNIRDNKNLSTTGLIYVNGNDKEVGQRWYRQITKTNVQSSTSPTVCTNTTNPESAYLNLYPGIWYLQGYIVFPSNSTGRRYLAMKRGASLDDADTMIYTRVNIPAVNGGYTAITTNYIINCTNEDFVSLTYFQNSTTAMTVTTRLDAMKIA